MALKHCKCSCSESEIEESRKRVRRESVLSAGVPLPQSRDEDKPRESWQLRLAELKFGKKVGVGNVGVVYAGRYRGDRVAIKRLLGNWYKHEGMVARFREEIVLMSQLDHPNGKSYTVVACSNTELGCLQLLCHHVTSSMSSLLLYNVLLFVHLVLRFVGAVMDPEAGNVW